MPDRHEIAEHEKERKSQLIERVKVLKKALNTIKINTSDSEADMHDCDTCRKVYETAEGALNVK